MSKLFYRDVEVELERVLRHSELIALAEPDGPGRYRLREVLKGPAQPGEVLEVERPHERKLAHLRALYERDGIRKSPILQRHRCPELGPARPGRPAHPLPGPGRGGLGPGLHHPGGPALGRSLAPGPAGPLRAGPRSAAGLPRGGRVDYLAVATGQIGPFEDCA